MHQGLRADDVAAKGFAYGLMAQTHAQQGDFASKMLNGRQGNARLLWRTRARAYQQVLGRHRGDFFYAGFIVALHHHVLAQFGQVLHDVVSETVIVVYH